MRAELAVLPGDGIGPEVTAEALRCLRRVAELFGHELKVTELPFGGAAIERGGGPLPEPAARPLPPLRCRAPGRGGRACVVGPGSAAAARAGAAAAASVTW